MTPFLMLHNACAPAVLSVCLKARASAASAQQRLRRRLEGYVKLQHTLISNTGQQHLIGVCADRHFLVLHHIHELGALLSTHCLSDAHQPIHPQSLHRQADQDMVLLASHVLPREEPCAHQQEHVAVISCAGSRRLARTGGCCEGQAQ